jgi:hypothetical protein
MHQFDDVTVSITRFTVRMTTYLTGIRGVMWRTLLGGKRAPIANVAPPPAPPSERDAALLTAAAAVRNQEGALRNKKIVQMEREAAALKVGGCAHKLESSWTHSARKRLVSTLETEM